MLGLLSAFFSGGGLNVVNNAIDKIAENKEHANAIKREVELELLKNQKSIDTAGADIIKKEIEAGGLAAQWRPILALAFGGIVVFYTIMQAMFAFGWVSVSVAVPSELWNLMLVMIGGYTLGRSGEKMVGNLKK
ncbi:MAG: holin family protein [Candidatus Thiodiazotropha taylori]|uniref:Holin family protein n=1 Tax=Candidatus Thiodiazotropha taylori TaxID=2792791 RepID=A0A9E4N3I1_9GAMM|nr:holin family protein [Candidatus Thiodiazotropha taylori]MCW4254994.1 holin family protein [Candidatus Thiodiazotropha taylori]